MLSNSSRINRNSMSLNKNKNTDDLSSPATPKLETPKADQLKLPFTGNQPIQSHSSSKRKSISSTSSAPYKNLKNRKRKKTPTKKSQDESDVEDSIDLEYLKMLQAGNKQFEKEGNFCSHCEQPGILINCQGTCQRFFHPDCTGRLESDKLVLIAAYKCDECTSGQHTCFLCKKLTTESGADLPKKCTLTTCGKYYHDQCAKSNPLFFKEITTSNANASAKYMCPLHKCFTCYADQRSVCASTMVSAFSSSLFKCIRCPRAYHANDFCLGNGSVIVAGYHIICPEHLRQGQAVKVFPPRNLPDKV